MRAFALRLLVALAALLGGVLVGPGLAAAHTGLATSTPAAGASVPGPLAEVVLTFTGTPTASDDSVSVVDADGTTFRPVSVVQSDLEVVATFDPPLVPGRYAVAWQVRSDDTHVVDGTFPFTVAGSADAATGDASSTAGTVDHSAMDMDGDAMVMADGSQMTAADHAAMASGSAVDTEEGDGVTRIGRLFYLPAGVVALGMTAFAAFAFVGRRDELDGLVRAVRWLGVFVAFGAFVEVVGLTALIGGFGEVLGLGAGRASLARVVAGVLVVVGFASVGAAAVAGSPARSLSSAVLDTVTRDDVQVEPGRVTGPWRPTGLDVVGLGGLAVFALSFAFDGHTVSRGPRVLHSIASTVHVVGAGVWAGGLVALAVVLVGRRRAGEVSRAVESIVRFSVVAMVALAATGVAGVAMALFIDSDVFGYPSTEWGRFMIAKLLAVAIAVGIGAWNHFVLMPKLRAHPDDATVVDAARTTVTVEATAVVTAALLTALLVAASTL